MSVGVGRWKEPILGFVPKNDEKKNLVRKGQKSSQMIFIPNRKMQILKLWLWCHQAYFLNLTQNGLLSPTDS